VFEIAVGCHLFRYGTNERLNLTSEEYMLYQIATLTGERFMAAQLNVSPLAAEYFTPECEFIILSSCKTLNICRQP
jgi:hypothetical protein